MGLRYAGPGSCCHCGYGTLPLLNPKSTLQQQLQQLKNKTLNRRTLNLSILLGLPSMSLFFAAFPPLICAETDPEQLERYTDEKEGFTLTRPSSWVKVEKAGATVLFEDPEGRANNVGIVVSPVRISSLRDFGSPQDVAQKLIQAEKRKARLTMDPQNYAEEEQNTLEKIQAAPDDQPQSFGPSSFTEAWALDPLPSTSPKPNPMSTSKTTLMPSPAPKLTPMPTPASVPKPSPRPTSTPMTMSASTPKPTTRHTSTPKPTPSISPLPNPTSTSTPTPTPST